MRCRAMEMSDTSHIRDLLWVVSLEQEGVSFPSPQDRALSPTLGQQLHEQGLIDYLLSPGPHICSVFLLVHIESSS